MRVFSPVKEASAASHSEILNELRSIAERQGTGLRKDSFLSLTHDRDDQFLLKSVHNFILWGKVFFEPFTPEKAQSLKGEQEAMRQKFSQPIKLQVFFGGGGIDSARSGMYPEADYFHYSMIQSSAEKAMIVEKVVFAKEAPIETPLSLSGEVVKRPGYNFSRQSQLTRNELAELIDLSLALKRF